MVAGLEGDAGPTAGPANPSGWWLAYQPQRRRTGEGLCHVDGAAHAVGAVSAAADLSEVSPPQPQNDRERPADQHPPEKTNQHIQRMSRRGREIHPAKRRSAPPGGRFAPPGPRFAARPAVRPTRPLNVVIQQTASTAPDGQPAGRLGDGQDQQGIGNFPGTRLAISPRAEVFGERHRHQPIQRRQKHPQQNQHRSDDQQQWMTIGPEITQAPSRHPREGSTRRRHRALRCTATAEHPAISRHTGYFI